MGLVQAASLSATAVIWGRYVTVRQGCAIQDVGMVLQQA